MDYIKYIKENIGLSDEQINNISYKDAKEFTELLTSRDENSNEKLLLLADTLVRLCRILTPDQALSLQDRIPSAFQNISEEHVTEEYIKVRNKILEAKIKFVEATKNT